MWGWVSDSSPLGDARPVDCRGSGTVEPDALGTCTHGFDGQFDVDKRTVYHAAHSEGQLL